MKDILPIPVSCSLWRGCLVLCLLLAITQGALAHSPSDMKVTFDEGTGQLSVTITHQVADPATHYVKEVRIQQGGTVLLEPHYTSQPSLQTFTYTYPLPTEVTGAIEVKAECSLSGEITRTLQIVQAPTATPTATAPTVTSTSTVTSPTGTGTTTATTPASTTIPATAAPSPAAGSIGLAALGALAILAVWWARR